MRAIDGDDFLKQSTELYEFAGWDEREVHFSLADLRCNLEMMPTVEAIPVEWIERFGKENFYDWDTEFNAISVMLDAWRKEK
ncbi:MAG: hypothetical protein E7194_12780 [Erysipelotrichaceae bacterium]|nr:hypothetical protein [Erysipelotrichaceae bacterium]